MGITKTYPDSSSFLTLTNSIKASFSSGPYATIKESDATSHVEAVIALESSGGLHAEYLIFLRLRILLFVCVS